MAVVRDVVNGGSLAVVVEPVAGVAEEIAGTIESLGYGTVAVVAAVGLLRAAAEGVALVVVGIERETPGWQQLLQAVVSLPSAPRVVIASRTATREQMASALSLGIDGYVDKPVAADALRDALQPDALRYGQRAARAMVGQLGLKDAMAVVRDTMVEHALCCTGESRRAAAKVLQVNRRVVQRCLEQDEPLPSDQSAAAERDEPRKERTTGVHQVVSGQRRKRLPSARVIAAPKTSG